MKIWGEETLQPSKLTSDKIKQILASIEEEDSTSKYIIVPKLMPPLKRSKRSMRRYRGKLGYFGWLLQNLKD